MTPLRFRIILPILLIHLIVIPLSVYQFLLRFEEPFWEAQKRLARVVLEEMEDQIGIRHMASNGSREELQQTVDRLREMHGLSTLRVYDHNLVLRAHHGEDAAAKPDPAVKDTNAVLFGDRIEATRWIQNKHTCYGCHDPSQSYLGVIQTVVSVSEIASTLASQRRHAMVSTFTALLAVFSLVYAFHFYFIVAPVRSIVKEMTKVAEGDLSTQIPVMRKDELGIIAERFNEVVRSLHQAKAELEKRHHADMSRAEQLATVGEIAAGLAHEVKNPIAGIESALEVVISETDSDHPHREVMEEMIKETRRITSTINQLLDYARPKEPKPEMCDVQMILGDIQSIFSPQCQVRRVSFIVHSQQDLGQMFVDAQELKQVLINVLRNSLEALNDNGTIELSVEPDQDRIVFSIIDNGPGMDAAIRSKIFQPFFTTKPGGTGLGLAIVYRLVSNMGGKLSVESVIDKGTCFMIELPRECHRENTHRG